MQNPSEMIRLFPVFRFRLLNPPSLEERGSLDLRIECPQSKQPTPQEILTRSPPQFTVDQYLSSKYIHQYSANVHLHNVQPLLTPQQCQAHGSFQPASWTSVTIPFSKMTYDNIPYDVSHGFSEMCQTSVAMSSAVQSSPWTSQRPCSSVPTALSAAPQPSGCNLREGFIQATIWGLNIAVAAIEELNTQKNALRQLIDIYKLLVEYRACAKNITSASAMRCQIH
jgi:hypothetical protein